MTLENIVANFEDCQKIHAGEFGESALVWEHAQWTEDFKEGEDNGREQRLVVERKEAIKHAECKSAGVMLYPAPTLQEIRDKIKIELQKKIKEFGWLWPFENGYQHWMHENNPSEALKILMRLEAKMKLYCCSCKNEVEANRVTGCEIYPHRSDLADRIFFQCPTCKNYVGTHTGGKPLGVIPTPEIRAIRSDIHAILDPIWINGTMTRKKLYRLISDKLGYEYHTGNIRSVEEAINILEIIKMIRDAK